MSKTLHYLTAALLAAPLSTLAQQAHAPVGIAGIVLDGPVDSVPRSFALKCETSLRAVDAPSSKDSIVRSLQGELQRAKARGSYTCYSECKSVIGRLRTESVMVTSEHGRIRGIYLSFVPEEEDADTYNTGARTYVAGLIAQRYGPGVASSSKTSWERWSPLKYEHKWELPTARIEIVDEPRYSLRMTFYSNTRFAPDAATRTSIASIEKKIAVREQKLRDQKAKAASLAERDLFPSG